MTTYRERREARADNLDGWAEKRAVRATAAAEAARDATAGIPFGQPILVGHHSERRHRAAIAKGDRALTAAVEHSTMARTMSSRADEIRRQAASAIYSDDPDAAERLTAKIAALETEREQMKAANAAFRKAHKTELRAMSAYQRGQAVPFPSYALTNLGGRISTAKARLETIGRPPVDRMIEARYDGGCEACGAAIEKGQCIRYNRTEGARCVECAEGR